MDKIDTIASLNHNITINERKNIIISGVKKIESYDNEEFSLGIGCLAVPIFDAEKNCIGALGITGSIQEYRKESTFQNMLQALLNASSNITSHLGTIGPSL